MKGLKLRDAKTGAHASPCSKQSLAPARPPASSCPRVARLTTCCACATLPLHPLAGETRDLHVRGLFYGIGHTPNSGAQPGGGGLATDYCAAAAAAALLPTHRLLLADGHRTPPTVPAAAVLGRRHHQGPD